MANDNFVNYTGLGYFFNRLKMVFAGKSEFDELDEKVDGIIAEGGEPNVIEKIKKNGTMLQPDAEKAVDITVPTKTSDLENDGDGSGQFASKAYVDEQGGKIDTIAVNDVNQPTVEKRVNITVPTKTSDITNDSDYQTEEQVNALIADALAGITEIDFEVVQQLPATGEKGIIYLVPLDTPGADDLYQEFIWVGEGSEAHFESLGKTTIDLTNYWSKEELTAITTEEIDALFE